jgi:ATP-dependent DNA helicase RecG
MKENSLYDKKSLRAICGKNADFDEIAKDCVAFSNAQGGNIDFGIEDGGILPPYDQSVPEDLPTILTSKIRGLVNGVSISAKIITATNGGEYLRLSIFRNSNSVSMTTSGKNIH